MDYIQIALSARLVHSELVCADAALKADVANVGTRLILIKQLLISCANVADLESISRVLYKDHPELSKIVTPHRRNFDFTKYIRNIAVGHLNPALCRKPIEWRPEINALLARPESGTDIFLGYVFLETAINTYIDGDNHKIFESETDFGYPPDMTRYLNFLGDTVHVGIAYCEALASVAVGKAELPDFQANLLRLATRAGQTEFKFITRKGQSS